MHGTPASGRMVTCDELQLYGVDDAGRPRVERKYVAEDRSSTIGVHASMDSMLAAFVGSNGRVDVADLPPEVQAMVEAETESDRV